MWNVTDVTNVDRWNVECDERDERGLVDPWERRNKSHEGVEETRECGT
jgi:hypothetical protein